MFDGNLRYALVLAIALAPGFISAQEPPPRETTAADAKARAEEPQVQVLAPVSPLPDANHEPRALQLRSWLLAGGFHLYPAWEPGPYQGPPARIWQPGWWGTTLWRDPVTGWPLQ
jgi:hypothetical protein